MSEQPDIKQVKSIDIKEFRDFGWVQEINRLMLHPAGLALVVKTDEHGNETLAGVWDYRDDPEGMAFGGPDRPDRPTPYGLDPEKAERVAAAMVSKAEARFKLFGSNVQVVIQPPTKKTLAIDFDGVIHAYSKGWEDGSIYDVPVEGTRDALRELASRYRLVVFTARENLAEVQPWLVAHELDEFIAEVTNHKPKAWAYLDDRGVRFSGSWHQALATLTVLAPDDAWKVIP